MSEWKFTFPQSRTCLWDGSPVGEITELFITRNGWLRVQLSVPALHLAVRHARQSSRKPYDCFLIATTWITEGENIVVEVDRFDPGRLLKGNEKIVPTALIPGDIAIPCQVVVGCHPLSKHLTHNLVTLNEAFDQLERHVSQHPCPLDPAKLVSLRVHCGCTKDGGLNVTCGCVSPAVVCEATPIKPIPIVKTALARNLSGPLPLSMLQGRVKHGYVTMDSTRKVVLLLHSDPKATQLPLVGVWVSGVGSVYHPQVWTACVSYTNSLSLSDRVWSEGGGFLLLVYVQGATQPTYWQCATKTGRDGLKASRGVPYEVACGDTSIQPASDTGHACIELFPAQESTALKTLLETALKSSVMEIDDPPLKELSCDLPYPSPKPTPTLVPQRPIRDSELSMLSSLSISEHSALDVSHPHHYSITSLHSATVPSLPARPLSSQSQHMPGGRGVDAAAPSYRPTLNRNHQELHHTDKENISPDRRSVGVGSPVVSYPQHDGVIVAATSASEHQASDGLILFPEKQVNTSSKSVASTSSSSSVSAPSPHTQEMLRQQELQLRILQEQVKSLLRSQSANSSPLTRASGSPSTPSRAEAGTNTGQSLFWRPSSSPSPPRDSTAPAPASAPGSRLYDDDTSVCSSAIADLSVQTATSILSQGVSEMHLDLQSYANSPTSSHSQSFGDSASTAGYEQEGNSSSHESSPASLLFRDQRQFYQNMLAQVNDLIQSQQQSQASDSGSDPLNHSSEATPKQSPSLKRSMPRQSVDQEASHTTTGGYVMETSDGSSHRQPSLECDSDTHHSFKSDRQVPHKEMSESSREESNPSLQSHRSEHTRPEPAVPNRPYTPFHLGDQSLPPLHPDVLQQRFGGSDISMLPVPRIMYVGSGNEATYRAAAVGATFVSQLGGADLTLDENTRMADMIALKYLGKNSGVTSAAEVTDGVTMLGLSSGNSASAGDKTMAHMSMATRQYLEKYNLVKDHQAEERLGKEDRATGPTERILDVQRLKTLPKLI